MPGAGQALGLAQVRHTRVRLAQVRHPRVRLAQVGPVAVIPQWISKMQECRGRECPSIEPDSRRAAYGRWLRL